MLGLGIGLGSGFDYFCQYNVIRRIGIRRNGAEPKFAHGLGLYHTGITVCVRNIHFLWLLTVHIIIVLSMKWSDCSITVEYIWQLRQQDIGNSLFYGVKPELPFFSWVNSTALVEKFTTQLFYAQSISVNLLVNSTSAGLGIGLAIGLGLGLELGIGLGIGID